MTTLHIARQRLCRHSIAPAACVEPGEVAKKLDAVQAQDYLGALWAIGLRMKTATEKIIEQAICHRQLIRTWPMRGTLHFVAPEDVRWMLALLTPRVIAGATRRHQQLELDAATFTRSEILLTTALQGVKQGWSQNIRTWREPKLILFYRLVRICWCCNSASRCSF